MDYRSTGVQEETRKARGPFGGQKNFPFDTSLPC
jgi:hypothetical protein